MPTRFENTGEGLYTFADVFYVKCLVCGGCATVREIGPEQAHGPSPARTHPALTSLEPCCSLAVPTVRPHQRHENERRLERRAKRNAGQMV